MTLHLHHGRGNSERAGFRLLSLGKTLCGFKIEEDHLKTISVIVPAYNEESTIERMITSSLKQTLPADKIIIVDDYSSDSVRAHFFEALFLELLFNRSPRKYDKGH